MKTNMEITLLPKLKAELRRLYSEYVDTTIHNPMEVDLVVAEYKSNYPLVAEVISIDNLHEHIYSKNQQEFINDATETEFEIDYGYSGRGMYGDVCPAIRCDSHNDITTKAKTVIDSMGLGIVIYAQY